MTEEEKKAISASLAAECKKTLEAIREHNKILIEECSNYEFALPDKEVECGT